MYEAHEGAESFFTAQGYSSESFEFVEKALDLMALLIKFPVDSWSKGAAGVGLDLRGCTKVIGDKSAQWIGVIGCIGDDMADAFQA